MTHTLEFCSGMFCLSWFSYISIRDLRLFSTSMSNCIRIYTGTIFSWEVIFTMAFPSVYEDEGFSIFWFWLQFFFSFFPCLDVFNFFFCCTILSISFSDLFQYNFWCFYELVFNFFLNQGANWIRMNKVLDWMMES